MYESWEQKSEDDCRCQSVKNVLAGDCHEVVITCDVACGLVSPSWGGGSVTPDGQSHHSLSDAGHILSMMTGQSSAQESQRWESWGDGKHEQHSAQNTNHTAVESDYHFTCLTTTSQWKFELRVGKYPRVMTPEILGSCTYHYHSTFLIPVTGLWLLHGVRR